MTSRAPVVSRLLERNDALLKHGIIVLAAGFVGNLLNYLYQLVMGRMLGPEQYGMLGALISLTYVLTVPTQTIQTSTAKLISKLRAAGRSDDLGHAIRRLGVRVTLGCLAGLVAVLAASGGIARFLRLPSAVPALVLGPVFFFGLLAPTLNGGLLGLQRFARLGASQVVNFTAKLVFGIALVGLGLGVEGALGAFAVGIGFSLLLSMYFLRDVLRQPPVIKEMPRMSSYSFYTLLAFLFLTLLYNVDVILVRRFFADAEAGYYVAAATVAKAVYFGSIAIAGAMFPKVAAWGESGNGAVTGPLLRDTLLYAGLLAGSGALILNLVPGTAVSLLFGAAYAESARLVGPLSLAMLFLSLSYVLVSYQLALGAQRFVAVLVVGLLVQGAGIATFHRSLQDVALVMIAVMLLVLGGTAALAVAEQGRFQRQGSVR